MAPSNYPPTVREKSQGPVVRVLQAVLNNKGYNSGTPDGVFGPKTKQAVMAFQRAQGLRADGIVGPNTWSRLQGGPNPPPPPPPQPQTGQGSAAAFVEKALSQRGDPYKWGARAGMNDPNPKEFDCAELVRWAAHQVGVFIPDGSMNQLAHVKKAGLSIPIDQAIRTRGALLFRRGHVAISLGDGNTMEARGAKYGVNIFSANGRGWIAGGLIPGMRY